MNLANLLTLLTLLLAVFTLVPLSRYQVWWVRGFDFPRLQFFVFASILLALNVFLLDSSLGWSWVLILLNLLCLAIQAWWIAPYTRLFPHEVKDAVNDDDCNGLAIITANVLANNRNADALIRLIQNNKPDIVVTLESDHWWQGQLQVLEIDYPHTIKCPLDNLYGMHLYSRLALAKSSIEYLVEEDVPSIHTQIELDSGVKVRAHFLHPAPPSPTENEESSERDAELILVAKSIAETDQPTIVAGDLNDVAWSATTRLFRKISGLLDPRIGRGMYNSFHADYQFIRWPLDHLFHSSDFQLLTLERLAHFGSDHFAILTRLVYRPAAATKQQGLDADAKDHQQAEATLRDQGANSQKVPEPE